MLQATLVVCGHQGQGLCRHRLLTELDARRTKAAPPGPMGGQLRRHHGGRLRLQRPPASGVHHACEQRLAVEGGARGLHLPATHLGSNGGRTSAHSPGDPRGGGCGTAAVAGGIQCGRASPSRGRSWRATTGRAADATAAAPATAPHGAASAVPGPVAAAWRVASAGAELAASPSGEATAGPSAGSDRTAPAEAAGTHAATIQPSKHRTSLLCCPADSRVGATSKEATATPARAGCQPTGSQAKAATGLSVSAPGGRG